MALVGAHVPKNLLQQGNILSDTNISNENRKMIRLSGWILTRFNNALPIKSSYSFLKVKSMMPVF